MTALSLTGLTKPTSLPNRPNDSILQMLSSDILLTKSGTLVDLRTHKTSTQIKDLVLYPLHRAELVKQDSNLRLVCAVEHDLVVVVQMADLSLDS